MAGITGLVFGFAGLLALIALLPPLAERLRLPYTVLLAMLGSSLGIAIGLVPALAETGMEGVAYDLLTGLGEVRLTADLFLWVFLPLLLFETALALDARELYDDIVAVLVMAVLAVGVTTLLAGLAVWSLAEVSLVVALLVAAIVATTDPAAVVAIFREVGAPRRLTALVEGESLLNDAAAIALFTALLALLVGGQEFAAGAMMLQFAWSFVGGALVGLLAGRLAVGLVSRLDQGGPAEVTLSVALAYLAFALAERYAGVSGVVAVVAAGLVFGTYGRARISFREWRSFAAIWTQIGFWASSLIFVLASTLVPRTLMQAGSWDVVLLLVLILGTLVARAFTLWVVLPAVGRIGRQRPVDDRYKMVMLWGGLRGAVTLALALAVAENRALPADVQHLVSVLATSYVLFTLLVQGTTLRPLLRWLALDRPSGVERLLRQRVLALTRAEVRDELSAAAIDHGLDVANVPVELEGPSPEELDAAPPEADERMLGAQFRTALATITSREAELYVEEIADRMVSRAVGAELVRGTGYLLDALKAGGVHAFRQAARAQTGFDRATRIAAFLQRRLYLHRPLASRLAMRVERLLVQRRVMEDLIGFNRRRIRTLFGARVAETAQTILDSRMAEIERALDAIRLQYPRHWERVSGQYLGRIALRLEMDAYRRLNEERLLSPQLFRALSADLRERRQKLEHAPRLDLGLETTAMIARVPLFGELSAERVKELVRLLKPRLALPGERILRRGEPGDAMYFIASGAVEVLVEPEPVRLGSGEFFGEMALILRRPRHADVRALGYSRLLRLDREAFRRFLKLHPELMREVRKVAEARLRQEREGVPAP